MYQTHHAISYSFKVVSSISEWKHEVQLYHGEDAYINIEKIIHAKYIKNPKPFPELSSEEREEILSVNTCHICKGKLKFTRKRLYIIVIYRVMWDRWHITNAILIIELIPKDGNYLL